MADDRLDDAIDAVVRAVDRIERATRASVPDGPAAPTGPAETAGAGTTSTFWAPRSDPPGQQPGGGFDGGAGLGAGLGQRPESTAEFSALGAAHVQSFAGAGASPQTHELVGRIVGRMQALDDHLAAASQLRREISELVARLAAAAGSPR